MLCVAVFLLAMLEGVNSSVYIGLNDMHTNNHFVWQDNEEVTVTYWAPNQPSESRNNYGTAKVGLCVRACVCLCVCVCVCICVCACVCV